MSSPNDRSKRMLVRGVGLVVLGLLLGGFGALFMVFLGISEIDTSSTPSSWASAMSYFRQVHIFLVLGGLVSVVGAVVVIVTLLERAKRRRMQAPK